jgi:drug/metabolite transporter (DMT)-like permease
LSRLHVPLGELICVLTALIWAITVTLYRAPIERHGARAVNQFKCTLGAVLQGVTVLALGQATALASAPTSALALLLASGVIGLALGDTALFAGVARIGVHPSLLLQTLSPVFAAIVAATWRGELLSPTQAAGAAVVLLGVALVVAPGRSPVPCPRPEARRMASGVALGILSAMCQGGGLVLAKVAMETVPVAASSFARLTASALALTALGIAGRRWGRVIALARDRTALPRMIPATLLGTYLALFLMMAGIALAPAPVAAVLLATSPVFSLLLERVTTGRPLSLRGIAGTLTAIAGVAVLMRG